jgi:hypothetical protein
VVLPSKLSTLEHISTARNSDTQLSRQATSDSKANTATTAPTHSHTSCDTKFSPTILRQQVADGRANSPYAKNCKYGGSDEFHIENYAARRLTAKCSLPIVLAVWTKNTAVGVLEGPRA